jgi:hypothetical protein
VFQPVKYKQQAPNEMSPLENVLRRRDLETEGFESPRGESEQRAKLVVMKAMIKNIAGPFWKRPHASEQVPNPKVSDS